MPPFTSRYVSLDHWRGIAALWVLGFHASYRWITPATGPLGWLHQFADLGWFGVHLFFVISGYCLAERAARNLSHDEGVLSFVRDRACRIFPLYWVVLVLSLALAAVATPFNHLPLFMTSDGSGALPGSAWVYIREAALLSPWCNETPYVLISWTLTSELAFYLLVAVGLGLIRVVRRPAIPLMIGFVLAAAQASRLLEFRVHVLEGWPEFICGMLVWLVLRPDVANNIRGAACSGIVALGTLGFINHLHILSGAAGFALLLILLKRVDGRLARMPLLRVLGMIGVFSYSLYLIHLPIISPMQNLLHRLLTAPDHRAWIPVVLGTVAVLSAWVLYRWVERPLESWRRHSRLAIDSPVVTVPVK